MQTALASANDLRELERVKGIYTDAFGAYKPHSQSQIDIQCCDTRFRVVCCGRRYGKTTIAVNETIRELKGNNKIGWWVAPTYPISNKGWREFLLTCPRDYIKSIHKADKVIELIWGSTLWFKSADNPDSLVSEGLDWLVLDEAALNKADAWERSLRPALADKQGKALFITTPRGKNWFYKLYMRGLSGNANYKSFTFPTSANPIIAAEEIEEARKTLPDVVFRQEYLAEFIDDAGAVFRNINACVRGELETPYPGEAYKIGIDIAKERDFTVATVMKMSNKHVVAFDRYHHISYDMVLPRINELSKRYNNAQILVDSTGVGDPVYDMLAALGCNIEPFKFTNPSKENLIRGLMVALENQEISYPRLDVLIAELESFEYKTGTTGVIRYGAPEGFHDDCVISLALVVKACRKTNAILDFFHEEQNKKPEKAGLTIDELMQNAQELGGI